MFKRIRYIILLVLMLSGAKQALAQATMPENVCVGSERHYWVTGTPGSTYTWKLDGVMQPSISNFIDITWSNAGKFKLEVQEHQMNCSGEVQMGFVNVYDQPTAFAGHTLNSCSGSAVVLTEATAQNFGSLLWTSSGDGAFDDVTKLQTNYTPGPNDILAGGTYLTLKAEGLGNSSTCMPAISTVRINIIKLEAVVSSFNINCYGASNGKITIANQKGGSGNYEFTINGTVWTGATVFNALGPGVYPVQMRDKIMPSCVVPLENITITQPDPLIASIRFTNATCLGNDGTITIVNPHGGSGSYEYSIGRTWSNGFFSSLVTGTYTVRIRDANVPDCIVVIGSVVITKPEPVSGNVSLSNVTCFGGSDGRISITDFINGSGIYEFSIDGTNWISPDKLPFGNLIAGRYVVQMRDHNAPQCVETLSNSVITEPDQLKAGISSTNVNCFGYNDGSISVLNPTGGSGSYEFSIDGSNWQKITSFKGLFAGKYSVQMRDFNVPACMVTIGEIEITQPLQLQANVNFTDITCFGAKDGKITISNPINGKKPYQFTIDGMNWTANLSYTNLGPGSYTVQMRDANNCTQNIGNLVITEPEPLSATINSTNATCLGNDGTITITNPVSGSGLYEFSIDGLKWTNRSLFTKLKAKTYIVQIRDSLLTTCGRNMDTITISEPEQLIATVEKTNVTCFEGSDGTITISNPTGGSGIYEFSIDGSDWKPKTTFIDLKYGIYTVRMRDANAINCAAVLGNFEILQPEILSATIVPVNVTCYEGNDGSLSFTKQHGGSGNYEYSINGTDWFTNKIENLKIGVYTVQMRDANAIECMITLSPVEIKQPDKIIAGIKHTDVTCFEGNDGTITIYEPLNGTAPYQYSMDGGTTWQTEGTFTGLTAKVYNLMVIQDVNTCSTKLQTVEINQPDKLDATVAATNETIVNANNGTITVSGQSGGSGDFEYSIDNITWQISPEFTGLTPGSYNVQIRDGNAIDCMISRTVYIYRAGTILANYSSTDITCYNGHDGSITFSEPSGATSYEYSIDGGSSWQSSSYFPGLTAQNYILKVRDASVKTNMTQIGVVGLKQPARLSATFIVGSETYAGAGDGTITISSPKGGSGEYQYSIDGVSWSSANVFSGLTSGTYNVWIQDKNAPDCKLSVQKIVQPAGALSADVLATDISCFGSNNGSIDISNPSGATDYDFSIDGGVTWQITGTFNGLLQGKYSPKLRDRSDPANVVSLGESVISEPNKLQASFRLDFPKCAGTSGTITITSKGGTGIISGTGTFDLAAGEHRDFTITDENGCSDNISYTMPAPDKIEATAVVKVPKCADENGTVTITATGGTEVYVGAETYTVQPGKSYNFKVTDSNGCVSNQISGTMPSAPPKLEATAVTTNPLCFGDSGSITVTAKGGFGVYSYQWDDPSQQTTPTITGLAPGVYSVTVTDGNDCSPVSVLCLVKVPTSLNPVAKVSVQPNCLITEGTIEFTEPLGDQYEYHLLGTPYQSSPVFQGLTPGNYSAQVRMVATGCESGTIDLTVNEIPQVQEVLSVSATVQPSCLVPTGTIEVSSPLGSDYEYSIDEINYQTSPEFRDLVPATYSVKLKLISTGCEITSSNLIIDAVPSPPEIPTAIVTKQPDCYSTTGTIEVTAPLGTRFNYSIDGLNYQSIPVFDSLDPATYSVKVLETSTGCESDVSSVTINPGLVSPATPVSKGDLIECAKTPLQVLDANTVIDPVSGVNVTWFDKPVGGSIVSSPTLNEISSKILYAEASNAVCKSATRTPVTLSILPNPQAPVASTTVNPTCNFPDGTVVVSSPKEGTGFEYNIDGGDYQSSATFTALKWGEHLVKVRQIDTGCESQTATSVIVNAIPPAPVLKVTSIENCKCNGGDGSISFAFVHVKDGVYNIKYDGGMFENINVIGGTAKVVAPAGTYNNLTIEANGCTSGELVTATITQPDAITIKESVTEIDLKSQRKGAIDLHVSGGSGTYSFIWSNGATTEDINSLNEGAYTVVVTDNKGCSQTKQISIPVPNFPPVAISDEFSVGCVGVNGNLLTNDYDPEGDPFFLDIHPVENALHGILTLNTDGTFEYQPDIRFSGTDYFRYAIYDANHYLGDTAEVVLTIVADFDCDGIPDEIDPDADGDGILNVDEAPAGQDWRTYDSDGDGNPNWLDIDSDNDGIVDNIEAQSTPGYIPPSGIDKNQNGIDDAYDPEMGGTKIIPVDTDGDGIPDFLDVDSDNDGVPDYIEGNDSNADGKADHILVGKDSDNDGLDDAFDTVNRYTTTGNETGSNAPMQDFDGDGIKDWRDENDDNDKYLTRFEDLNMDGDWSDDDLGHPGHPEYLYYGRDCDLFVPNIFTPNNDNVHDYFLIYCINYYPNAKIYIFDQNGDEIFEKDHYGNLDYWGSAQNALWNGRYSINGIMKNELVPVGTYYYVLNLGNGEVKKSYVFVSY